jgi:hypothetical protein
MWLEGGRLEQLDAALGAGRSTDIDRLLAEILAGGSSANSIPSVCSVCKRDLVRTEPRPGLVVSGCPEQHGAWLNPDALGTLRRLLDAQSVSTRTHRRHTALVAGFAAAAVSLAGLAALASGPLFPSPSYRAVAVAPITAAERRYLQQLMAVLDDGIKHRRDVEGVLKTESEADTYAAVYDIYRGLQQEVLARLERLEVPARIKPAHDRILKATERQIEFYGAFTEARVKDESADLARMLGHPALRESDYDLHAAWDIIRQTYPDLDVATRQAVEGHLCQFGAI